MNPSMSNVNRAKYSEIESLNLELVRGGREQKDLQLWPVLRCVYDFGRETIHFDYMEIGFEKL